MCIMQMTNSAYFIKVARMSSMKLLEAFVAGEMSINFLTSVYQCIANIVLMAAYHA